MYNSLEIAFNVFARRIRWLEYESNVFLINFQQKPILLKLACHFLSAIFMTKCIHRHTHTADTIAICTFFSIPFSYLAFVYRWCITKNHLNSIWNHFDIYDCVSFFSFLLLLINSRFKAGKIYTYIGEVCVSVNPYRQMNIYGNDYVNTYKGNIESIN